MKSELLPIVPPNVDVRGELQGFSSAEEYITSTLERITPQDVGLKESNDPGLVNSCAMGRAVGSLEVLTRVRDSLTHHAIVNWHATAEWFKCSFGSLVHLPAPVLVDDDPEVAPLVDQWRMHWRFGTLYYRRGPGFIQIKDMRYSEDKAIYVLDDPKYLAIFELALGCPVTIGRLREISTAATDDLLSVDILFEQEGWCIALPFRMRAWPVPYDAV